MVEKGRDFVLVETPDPGAMLIAACRFLADHPGIDLHEGSTVVFGAVARLLQGGQLSEEQSLAVFEFFNSFAEQGRPSAHEVLATDALEIFNDDAVSQRLARRFLRGKALDLLEKMRISWGQPDHGRGERP